MILPAGSESLKLMKPFFPMDDVSEYNDESQLTDAEIEIEISEAEEEDILGENVINAETSYEIYSRNVFEEHESEAVDDGQRWFQG